MCGPLNRKDLVCSECTCADGFGLSLTSFGYICVNCTGAWYGVPVLLLLEFAPVTVFYLVILVLQISLTSMPCFILYAQFVVVAFYVSVFNDNFLREAIYTEHGHLRLDMLIIHVLYGVL